jgi:hypothetical protein
MFIFVCSVYLSWVCWVRGNFSGEPGHVYIPCVCLRCVECRAGIILFGHFGGVGGGTVRIFLSLWLCSGGYGTVEMVKGVVRVFPCFLQFAVSSFGGWISAVGILCYIFVGSFFRGFLFYKVLIVNNLLQVVSSQSELRGGPGASA